MGTPRRRLRGLLGQNRQALPIGFVCFQAIALWMTEISALCCHSLYRSRMTAYPDFVTTSRHARSSN